MTLNLLPKLNPERAEKMNAIYDRRAKLYPSDYAGLLAQFQESGYHLVRLQDIFNDNQLHGQKVIGIRHDVDHDYVTALRIAEWEQKRGIHSTFCILHTAWYYGELNENGRYIHYREFIEFCHSLEDMGHEINIHNNYVVEALQSGHDAEKLFSEELRALRDQNLTIHGTSTHGDALCGKYQFTNRELMKGRAWDSRGGPRKIVAEGNSVNLGSVDGVSYGLTYEAYDYPRDIYCSDSGGRPRVSRNTKGIRGLRRSELEAEGFDIPFPSLCGILTHPIWWDFKTTKVQVKDPTFARAMNQAGLSINSLSSEYPHLPAPFKRAKWPTDGGDYVPLKIPTPVQKLHDTVAYKAPTDIKIKSIQSIATESCIEQIELAIRSYVTTNDEDHCALVLQEIALCDPNIELFLESMRLNATPLLKSNRYIDFAILIYSLSVATKISDSRDLLDLGITILRELNETEIQSITNNEFLSAIMAASALNLVSVAKNLDDCPKSKNTLQSALGQFENGINSVGKTPLLKLNINRHTESDQIKIRGATALYIACKAECKAECKSLSEFETQLLNEACQWIKDLLNNNSNQTIKWFNKSGASIKVQNLWPLIQLVRQCEKIQIGFDETEATKIAKFVNDVVLNDKKMQCIQSFPEDHCGIPAVLSLWPLGNYHNEILIKLSELTKTKEFSLWYRHPLSMLTLAERFSLKRAS